MTITNPLSTPELVAFTRDVLGRYPIAELELFGSRARGDHRGDSDWDVIVVLVDPDDAETEAALLNDENLKRHFGENYLDIFVVDPERGRWARPGAQCRADGPATPCEHCAEMRGDICLHGGFFPYSRWNEEQIRRDSVSLIPVPAAS